MTIDADLLARAAKLSTATVHEAAGRIGALPSTIKPLSVDQHLSGPAYPVKSPPGDNLWLHRALYAAAPGDVLVIEVGDGVEFGYWGEVMAVAAQVRGIAGLVITGGVRDSQRMVEMDFPVCAGAVCIQGTIKDPQGAGALNQPVVIGGVTIHPGDWVLGDADGVVVVPADRVADVVDRSERRDAAEQDIFAALRAGQTTIGLYGLPGGEQWRA